MYMSATLARDRSTELHEEAQHIRIARQAAQVRRVERIRKRAERRLLRAWQRSDELRATIEAVG
jgi:hypothetical protein